ncbi:hypothetical protein [Pseudomonas sp. Marseille-Q1929]|uniref:hypothetical protein n=1 Tax=Pseudomonas sp. Marseille-Q1929 TaxID=2730402 RepID=UPI001A8FA6C7|nr:hypothetical protein [Pseudomonas sp. Marseille-Q1929]MBO0496370.1 hypothetical protein [Pseudomonas sp. Marseille-Q1929]
MAKKPIHKKTLSSQPDKTAPRPPKKPKAQFPVPIVKFAANNSVLYPMDAIDGTEAKLTQPTGATDCTFFIAIKDQAEPAFEPIFVDNGDDVVPISPQLLSLMIGHTVLMWYTAIVGGKEEDSLVLELEVQFLREEDLVGSRPVYEHSKNEWNTWWLRMHSFTGDETVKVEAWPLIFPGQRLFVTVAGNQHIPPYRFIWVALDHVVQPHEARAGYVFRFPLSRPWMSRLDDYSALTAHLGVIWDGTRPVFPDPGDPLLENPLPINAQDFHLRTTTLLQVDPHQDLPPPHLRQSVDYNGGWHLNPELTKDGGDVDVPGLDTYAGDRVCFFVDGPGFAKKPLGCVAIEHDGDPASVKLSACIVACLFNKSMTLTYTLAFNESEQSSPAQDVSVSVPRFVHPTIEEATNGKVDLSTFTGGALATVPVWAYAECSNLCWMWITGKDGDGSAYRFDILWDEPVPDDWKAEGVEAPIPRAELQKLADCSEFELHFAVSFCEVIGLENAHEFPAQAFKVEQEPLDLLKPSVTEAVDDDLTVWNGRDGVHVEVDYVGKHPDHSISVCWSKPDGSCLLLPAQPGSDSIFFVPREAVIESMGKTIKITYTVTSACKVQISPPLNLKVSVAVRLPTPAVKQATPYAIQGGILDLRTFAGDADVVVNKWWFLLLAQHGWLECRGTDENGLPYTIKVATGHAITAPEVNAGLDMKLLRTELEKLRNKTALVVSYEGTPDVAGVRSNAIQFPVLNLEFRKAFYHHTDFEPAGKGWNGWQKGAGATDPRDLVEKAGPVPGKSIGIFLFNWGYANTTDPATQSVQLFQTFTGLEVGRQYKFSAWVRDNSGAGNKPRLVLTAYGVDISPVTLPGRAWEFIQGVFTAASSSALLTFENRQMGIAGNDFDVTQMTVEEL